MRFWATPPYNGCLVDYVTHPASFTFKLPDNVSVREGALVEPLAVGLSAAEKGDVKLGDTVVIFGAGCVGLVTLLAAKARGASRIIVADVIESRLNVARSFGGITIDSGKQDAVAVIMEAVDLHPVKQMDQFALVVVQVVKAGGDAADQRHFGGAHGMERAFSGGRFFYGEGYH